MDDIGTQLLQRWGRTLPGHPAIGEQLIARYCDPVRRYHNHVHLGDVLAAVDVLAPAAANLPAVKLAAWFHDAVYDVRRDDNEEQSARLAERQLLAAGVDAAYTRQVARLVRLTAGHNPSADDIDGAVLCDADLSILAAEKGRYAAYVNAVRKEHAHVDDDTFWAARASVLRQLLSLPQLFNTAEGQRRWADSARANIQRELAVVS